ncbi:MAG TPA: hypothetical protein VN609_09370 [Propionibacteriaceae bacterium]|nr:hypothetical protein [Propionibacteriaceae bacterium]
MNAPFSNVHAAPESPPQWMAKLFVSEFIPFDLLIEDQIPLTGQQPRVDH